MAKPILVTSVSSSQTSEALSSMLDHLKYAAPDYNHLILFKPEFDLHDVEFEVYNPQDYTEIDFETLKQQLLCRDNTESTK